MKKKNAAVILIILIECVLFYIMQPKKGSFNDLVLSQYQSRNFTEMHIVYHSEDSQLAEFRCNDKNKVDEFLSYLKTLNLVQVIPNTRLSDYYFINIRSEVNNSEGYLNANEYLSITVYGNNLNFIDVFCNDKSKTYKITNGKIDMKYIQDILKTGQV